VPPMVLGKRYVRKREKQQKEDLFQSVISLRSTAIFNNCQCFPKKSYRFLSSAPNSRRFKGEIHIVAMTARRGNKPVIVLDVCGVLVDVDLKAWFATLSKTLGIQLNAASASILRKLIFPVQIGEKSLDDIIPALNGCLGVSIASGDWDDLCCSIFAGEVPGMNGMLVQLKTDFFLVALTNIMEVHWTFLLRTYEILNLIDAYVTSYREGVAKPSPEIYQAVVDRYCDGRLPYFHTDDTPEYVEVARRMGWRSEVFNSASQLEGEVLGGHSGSF
jgi:hypothetical protein